MSVATIQSISNQTTADRSLIGNDCSRVDCSVFKIQQAFAKSCLPTLGAELELGIVDPNTGQPLKLFEQFRELLPNWSSNVHPEFLGCQIEYASRSHATVSELSRELASFCSSAKIVARSLHAELSWSGNFARWQFDRSMVTHAPRTEANLARLGANARNLATNSLHLHVAVPHSKAIQVIDGLQAFIPMFVALTANSPIHEGRVTAFKSHRVSVWANQFAVCGLTSPYRTWHGFEKRMRDLTESGRISSSKDLYYFARATRYGTIEMRCSDLPANLNQVLAVAALYQTLVVALCEGAISCCREVDLLRAELHEAYTYGIQAKLTSHHAGVLCSPLEWLERLRYDLEPIAMRLKTDCALAMAPAILEANGAEQQLREYKDVAAQANSVLDRRCPTSTKNTIIAPSLGVSAGAILGLIAGYLIS